MLLMSYNEWLPDDNHDVALLGSDIIVPSGYQFGVGPHFTDCSDFRDPVIHKVNN